LLDGATLFYEVDLNKLPHDVKNEIAFTCAEFGTDLANTSELILKLQTAKQSYRARLACPVMF